MTEKCNKCSNVLTIENKTEYNECRACNLGVFGRCDCKYYDVQIMSCFNCNIELNKCKECNKYFDKLTKNYCYDCINNIKLHNPSNNNESYEYDDNNLCWKIISRKQQCKLCTNERLFNNEHNKCNNLNYICNKCEIIDLKNRYKNLEFKITNNKFNDSIFYKFNCICNDENWIKIYYLDGGNCNYCYRHHHNKINYINQCKNCNPSNKFNTYIFCDHCKCWNENECGKKCNLCDIILWKAKWQEWGNIIQCVNCIPTNNFIKYKFINTGYKIDKIKIFNGNKHVWKNPTYNININYTCTCVKCSS